MKRLTLLLACTMTTAASIGLAMEDDHRRYEIVLIPGEEVREFSAPSGDRQGLVFLFLRIDTQTGEVCEMESRTEHGAWREAGLGITAKHVKATACSGGEEKDPAE